MARVNTDWVKVRSGSGSGRVKSGQVKIGQNKFWPRSKGLTAVRVWQRSKGLTAVKDLVPFWPRSKVWPRSNLWSRSKESLSVVNDSVDIPDVFNFVVDIPTKNSCGNLPKCHNVVEAQPNGITVICDFCPFESNHVKEFHQHLRKLHAKTYGSRWIYSDTCSKRILPIFTSNRSTIEVWILLKDSSQRDKLCRDIQTTLKGPGPLPRSTTTSEPLDQPVLNIVK